MPLYRWVGGAEAHVLPVPMLNVVNGGAHADNSLDLQEFMIVPGGAETFSEGLRIAVEVFHTLKKLLEEEGMSTAVGDEGGFAPDFPSSEDAIERVLVAIERAGHADRVRIALDPAMSELYADGTYTFEGREEASADLPELLGRARRAIPDRVHRGRRRGGRLGGLEGAHASGSATTCSSSATTCSSRTSNGSQRGIDEAAANAILIKVNQIGTLTETLDAIALARSAGYGVVMSHRSGETEDTTIADLAVATNSGQIKTGAPSRSDRVAKYNQLLRIEEELGDEAVYPGWDAFTRTSR